MFIPVFRYVKVIKIHQDFPELRLQMYCHLFMVHSVYALFMNQISPNLPHYCTPLMSIKPGTKVTAMSLVVHFVIVHGVLCTDWLIDWLRLNVAPTQYRSNGDGFLRVKWPNRQCQSTEGTHKTLNQIGSAASYDLRPGNGVRFLVEREGRDKRRK